MTPVFSVLIPVYNQMGKMDPCVASLRAQTFADFEVIWVDDGSTDGSGAFLDDLCREEPRFRVIHHEKNGSLTAARYTGMQNARGQYICFLDSDDWWEADTLATLLQAFQANPEADIIRFGLMMEPAHVPMLPINTDDFLRTYLEGKFPPAIWKNAYTAALIRRALPFLEPFYCNMGEDTWYCGVFFGLSKKDVRLEKVLYHYAMGDGMSNTGSGSTMAKLKRDYDSVRASGDHLLAFIRSNRPGYGTQAEKAVRLMRRFILWQNMQNAPDYVTLVGYLNFFRDEGDESTYRFGCDDLLRYRILTDLKRNDPRLADLPMPDLRTSMLEKE